MRKTQHFLFAVLLLTTTRSAMAVKIADITRMDGARTNVLTGLGLVVGLKGTGDGGTFLPAIRPLAALLNKLSDASPITDLSNAQNVAIVMVSATIPKNGAHNGDTLDVRIFTFGSAQSLKNGHLFNAALMGPNGKPYVPVDAEGHAGAPMPFALANGDLNFEDPNNLTNAIIKGGAVMEVNLPPKCIDNEGRFTLIIDEPQASPITANNIAKVINESNGSDTEIAVAVDGKTVVVQIPQVERGNSNGFISNILQLPVPVVPVEARVLINNKTNTITISGDVEISPTVISQKGLTITTVNPTPTPSVRNPQIITKNVVPLDTTNQGGARLVDLANAFDQLKVPAEDRITIVKQLYDTGKLHAKLVIDGQEQ